MKQVIGWFLVFMVLFSAGAFFRPSGQPAKTWENPYSDVTEALWSYPYLEELGRYGILPDTGTDTFAPEEPESRGDFILSLYQMENTVFTKEKKARKHSKPVNDKPAFADVTKRGGLYEAVCWAYQWGVSSGTSEERFSPDGAVTREQACTILARFAALEGLELPQKAEGAQFTDSLRIGDYARSGVTACQMAGLITGYENGYFYPGETIQRQEAAALLCRLITAKEEAAESGGEEGAALVDLNPGAYDSLYDTYRDPLFEPLIPAGEEGPLDFFAKTAFIGDSVSVMLMNYCGATGALGDATFLCAGSMSPHNMMTGKILPEYPAGSGATPPIQDSVAQSGAEVLYIMLGMNSLTYMTPQRAADSLVELMDMILEKNPKLTVIVESMTPMADSSTSYSDQLNNEVINQYNELLKGICKERNWYYLNVCEVLKDENGFLKTEYCSDYGGMGMHFNYSGTGIWADYIRTHIPAALL